ncbi:MAG TPA: cell division protein FtsA [Patescibacteria group bacterium]|nr:cell division protein FtsA [Patescibacteria group bacterium]
MKKDLLFALDIGTRSVVGLVGELSGNTIRLVASDREEHHTRAMLDGQIHDVQEVADVLASVKARLEAATGPLKKVAVAAAGRALCTIRAEADLDTSTRGILNSEDVQTLELSAIQSAQQQLATSSAVADPTSYYCVGYSVVNFTLDGNRLKSLVGQRGKLANAEVIATFLPRQVIDSLQSALQSVDLELDTLTLEPIAAINVLIPPTMRHLNLALVDVGAGTSDVAITRDGSVIGYGMVPFAGDEITETISQRYLLDFNIAEALKRQLLGKNKKLSFTDVLGMSQKVSTDEMLEIMTPRVVELAQAIATEIMNLNAAPPQAVLLVGGGALTPSLPEALSQALDIPAARVAVRCPDSIEGISNIPKELCTPDTVTPLGILKLAGGRTLNFINVQINEQPIRLFNLSNPTVADALLAGGVDIRSLRGRPGMGITVTIDGKTHFLAGTPGQAGSVALNSQEAKLTDPISDQDTLTVIPGRNGEAPRPRIHELATLPPPLEFTFNGQVQQLNALFLCNGQPAAPDRELLDRDTVEIQYPVKLSEILESLGWSTEAINTTYIINGQERSHHRLNRFSVNGNTAKLSAKVRSGDVITAEPPPAPSLKELLGLSDTQEYITVRFNDQDCPVPIRTHTVMVNGQPADFSQSPPAGSTIDFTLSELAIPILSDVLLAAQFNTSALPPGSRISVELNDRPAEYVAPVRNGDVIRVLVTPPLAAAERPTA